MLPSHATQVCVRDTVSHCQLSVKTHSKAVNCLKQPDTPPRMSNSGPPNMHFVADDCHEEARYLDESFPPS